MKKAIVFHVILIVLFMTTSCAPKKYSRQYWGMFDTVTDVEGYFDSEEEFERATGLVESTLSYYNTLFDAYNDADDLVNLKKINESGGETIEINKDMYDFLVYLKSIDKKTDSAVNAAFGSVTYIWKDTINNNAPLPSQDTLDKAALHTDFDSVILEESPYRVTLSDPELKIDAGAFAKGYAADRLREILIENGVENIIINMGGNVVAIGSKMGEGWNVGIKNPDGGIFTTVKVKDLSVVTSGIYERGREINGILYHHIISPDTLYPANNFLSVSVVCKSSAIADALSTALFVMDRDEGMKLLENFPEAEVLWIDNDGRAYYSSNFPK